MQGFNDKHNTSHNSLQASAGLYTILTLSILLNLYFLAYHFYRQRKMKLLQKTATITMKTKEDSEVLELSSVSENGPGTGTVRIDVVDSSKPKY